MNMSDKDRIWLSITSETPVKPRKLPGSEETSGLPGFYWQLLENV